jgi:hypothetical protein
MGRVEKTMATLVAAGLLTLMIIPFLGWIPDDAYISFQYARNLADGEGLVFNTGEHVEGFSNLLWTLVLALAARLGAGIEGTATALSIAAALVSLFLIVLLLLRTLESIESLKTADVRFIVVAFAMAAGLFFPLGFFATSGMESTFHLMCLLAGVVLHVRADAEGSAKMHGLSLLFFLAVAVLRPEGVGFLVLNTAFLVIRRERLPGFVFLFAALAFTALFCVSWIKYTYFGAWLPNTYFAKPPVAWGYFKPLYRGIDFFVRFFGKSGLVVLIPFALLVPRRGRPLRLWRYLWALALYQAVFIVCAGADVLRFDRFTLPLFPWLLALAAMGVAQAVANGTAGARLLAKRLLIAGVIVIGLMNGFQAYLAYSKYCIHDWMHSQVHREIGSMLGRALPEGSSIVVNEVGAIRYTSDHTVIDMLGLTDETVAAIRHHSFLTYGEGASRWGSVAVAQYIFDRNPTCIVLPSYGRLALDDRTTNKEIMDALWYAILTGREFAERFRPVIGIRIHSVKYLYVFVSEDVNASDFDLSSGRCVDAWTIGDVSEQDIPSRE